jgi:hypothetical protein
VATMPVERILTITSTSENRGRPSRKSRHMAMCHALLARRQSESGLGGSNGDSSTQLRLDHGCARLLGVDRITVATAEGFWSSTAMDSNSYGFRILIIIFVFVNFSLSKNF